MSDDGEKGGAVRVYRYGYAPYEVNVFCEQDQSRMYRAQCSLRVHGCMVGYAWFYASTESEARKGLQPTLDFFRRFAAGEFEKEGGKA